MTDAKARVFIDTNVLLRATIDIFAIHEAAKNLVLEQRKLGKELWISRQIIREFTAQATHPKTLPQILTPDELETHLNGFKLLYRIADETEAVTQKLIELLKRYPTGGKQVHDANIVATMLVNGIDTLLTQNIEDMKRFSPEITLVPLVHNPTT